MFSKFSNFVLSLLVLFLIIQPLLVHSRNLKSQKKSFQNFQNLEASIDQGQTAEGLAEVKKYLQNYGYYPTEVSELSDEFDEHLKRSLETYQKFYHLNITGTLNSATVKQMMVPRCGYPDIVNPETSTKHTGKLHLVSHYEFFIGEPKWPKYDLTYSFTGIQVVDQQVLKDVCASGFKKWSDVSKFKFTEAPEGERGDITIGFEKGDHGDKYPFDGPGRVLAHALPPTDGRLHLDAEENWSTNPQPDEIDLQSVVTHEMGHLLGLLHSYDYDAIMFPRIPPGFIKRDLGQDDIDGINALYKD